MIAYADSSALVKRYLDEDHRELITCFDRSLSAAAAAHGFDVLTA